MLSAGRTGTAACASAHASTSDSVLLPLGLLDDELCDDGDLESSLESSACSMGAFKEGGKPQPQMCEKLTLQTHPQQKHHHMSCKAWGVWPKG